MFTSLDAARGVAKRLKAATDGLGRPQKLTHCQAVVATACGFNGWQHLAKTLGTPHEPSGARDQDLALRRFAETMQSLLPDTLAPAIPGPVEAAVFLPSVWAKWADGVAGLVSAVEGKPLKEIASCLPSFRFNDGDGLRSRDGSGWIA